MTELALKRSDAVRIKVRPVEELAQSAFIEAPDVV
jgi:hypothetical protein